MIIHILFFIIILVVVIIYLEKITIFLPSRTIHETPKDIGIEYEDIYFITEDNVKLNGWLIKAPESKCTFLFTHGNAGNISNRLDKIKFLYDNRINVFLFDYRGYGRSNGTPSEKGMYADTLAAYEYLKSRTDIDQNKMVAYGVSLGGAAAVDIASKKPFAALIVNSTFSSAKDMARIIYPFLPTFLIRADLNSEAKIKNIKIPKLFFHSVYDEVVAFDLGKKLYDAAPMPKKFVALQGDHSNNFLEEDEKFQKVIIEFLSENIK